MPHSKLVRVSYRDSEREIYVSGYADILVYDEISHMLVAARFGGYPEAVRALADAISSGGSIDVETEEDSFRLYTTPKIYEKQLKKDAVYTEYFIKRKDDQNTKAAGDSEFSPGRRHQYIFTGKDDAEQLYSEIDRKTSVPMIPEFREYILEELQRRDCLKRLIIYSSIEEFDAWCLILDEDDKTLIKIVEDGLGNGSISIPGSTLQNKGIFKEIDGVMDYLEAFGVLIAEKIKSSFKPLKEFRAGNYTIYAIVSKERARDGYSKKPAVYYSRIKRGFICPSCYEKIMMELTEDGTKYLVDADQFFFRRETAQKRTCCFQPSKPHKKRYPENPPCSFWSVCSLRLVTAGRSLPLPAITWKLPYSAKWKRLWRIMGIPL